MQNFNNKLRKHLYKSKRVAIIAAFCVFILIGVQFNQVIPVTQIVHALDDVDNDGLEDDFENMTYYKYFEDTSTFYFNSEPGSQQGSGLAIHDFWVNFYRSHYMFSINVTQREGIGYLCIAIGDEGTETYNQSVTIDTTGTIQSPIIPFYNNDTLAIHRIRLSSEDNFTLDLFRMDSHTDYNDSDTDSDGLTDGNEDLDHDGMINSEETNPLIADCDNDGLNDGAEVNTHNTDPLDSDSDDDGLNDGAEVNTHNTDPLDSDSDDDGLSDGAEINTHNTDPLDSDSDDDGLNDGAEVNTHSTDPLDSDSDNDGLTDGAEVNTHNTYPLDSDSDDDGLTDGEEINTYFTDPLDNAGDKDEDGLSDDYEILVLETDHNDVDSDDDGLWDGYDNATHYGELSYHNVTYHGESYTIEPTDPNDNDSDGDGLSDYFEVITGWNVTFDGDTYQITSDPNRRISYPYGGSVYWESGKFYDDYYDFSDNTDPWLLDTDGDGYKDAEEEVIFRTNAVNGNYNSSNVWISVNHHNQGSHILDTYEYDSTVSFWYGDDVGSKVRSPNGYPIYRVYNQSTGERFLFIFFNEKTRTYTNTTAWKFTYSDDNDLSINSKLNESLSYKFVKDPVQGYLEVWLNNTISDMDGDGLLDFSERETDPFDTDTDNDGLSDYVEKKNQIWYYWDTYSKYENQTYFNEYLSPLVDDCDADGLLDGEEIGVMYRSNSLNGTYNESSWIAINNGSLLYTSSLWMSQFSGYGEYNTSIKQSISENYTQLTGYGYVGQYTNFSNPDELGYFLFNNSFDHAVYAMNFSTIFIDANSTDGVAMKFNLTSDAVLNANLTPFPVAAYGKSEVINISLWTNPFCDDSDGDSISDYNEIEVFGSFALDSDPDGDGLNDYYEVYYNSTDQCYSPFNGTSNETDLNPFCADTDRDGLWDGERIMDGNTTVHIGEISYVSNYPETDPLNNDTDDDGLLDGYIEGGEKVSFTYRSKEIVPILEGGSDAISWINETNARDAGKSGCGYLGYMNITLSAFITYNHSHDLSVTLGCIWKNGATNITDEWNITNDLGPGNDTYYVSYTLFDMLNFIHNWEDVLTIGLFELWKPVALGHWYVKVSDTTQNSSASGTIQLFELSIDYRTDATDSDSDDDGLSDWEESTFGNYGWITNPWDEYTDFDSLTDYEEVTGTGDAIKASNPCNIDTDGDGTEDGNDIDPTGNAYFTFNFSRMEILSACNDGDGGNNDVEPYPVITFTDTSYFENREGFTVPYIDGSGYKLAVLSADGESSDCPPGQETNWTIIYDVPDHYSNDTGLKSFWLRVYDEDDTEHKPDDVVNFSAADGTYSFDYNISVGGTQSYVTSIETGTEVRCYFNVTFDVITKMNTLLVLPANDTCSLNATNGTPGNTTDDLLRFTVPDMSFAVLMVNVVGEGNDDFDSGMNTILVPIPVFFSSGFWNLTNSTTNATLLLSYMQDANWTMYNNTETTSQISFVIVFNCTASNASALLGYFLDNATGNKTFWYEDITQDIYTIGLPEHVVTFTPSDYIQSTRWSGPGNPSEDDTPWLLGAYYSTCAIGKIVTDSLSEITKINFTHIFAEAGNLIGTALEAIGKWCLGAAKDPIGALNEIKEAVNNALNFVINWIIAFIKDSIESIINTLKSVVQTYIENFDLELKDFLTEVSWFDNETFTNASNSEKIAHMKSASHQGIEFYLAYIGLQKYADDLTKILDFIITNIEPYQSIFSITSLFNTLSSIIGLNINEGIVNIASFILKSSSSFFTNLLSELIIDGPIPNYYNYNFTTDANISTEYSMISSSALLNYFSTISMGGSSSLDIILELIKYILTESGFIDLFGDIPREAFTKGILIVVFVIWMSYLFSGGKSQILSYSVKVLNAITFFIELVAEENERDDLVCPLVISGIFEAFFTLIVDGTNGDEKGMAISFIQLCLHPFKLVL